MVHVKNFALVTRYADCEDCLSHDEVFAQPYAAKFELLTGGTNFFLGMADTPEYTHDVAAMRMVVRREDIPGRIVPFVQRTAEQLVAGSRGRIEIVSGLTSAVPTALVGDYFGTPNPPGGAFAAQSSLMSAWLFLPNDGTPGPSVAAAQSMRAILQQQIAAPRRIVAGNDYVLERSRPAGRREPRIPDAWILDQLFSFVVAAIPTTSAAVARAIDELLRRPRELHGAQMAARAGDTALVGKYINEAMRFSPLGPGVFRTTTAEYTIGAGTMHATTIPAGTTVLVALLSAMFDSERIDRPHDFLIHRPPWPHLLLGFGLHPRFGQYIHALQLPLIGRRS